MEKRKKKKKMSWAGRVSRQLLTDEPGEAELNHRRYYQEMEEPRKNPDKVNRERERETVFQDRVSCSPC